MTQTSSAALRLEDNFPIANELGNRDVIFGVSSELMAHGSERRANSYRP